jgi:hypothetical protein
VSVFRAPAPGQLPCQGLSKLGTVQPEYIEAGPRVERPGAEEIEGKIFLDVQLAANAINERFEAIHSALSTFPTRPLNGHGR